MARRIVEMDPHPQVGGVRLDGAVEQEGDAELSDLAGPFRPAQLRRVLVGDHLDVIVAQGGEYLVGEAVREEPGVLAGAQGLERQDRDLGFGGLGRPCQQRPCEPRPSAEEHRRDERQSGLDRHPGKRTAGLFLRRGVATPTGHVGDGRRELAPFGICGSPAPALELGALDLIEGQRWFEIVQGRLHQLVLVAGVVGLRTDPLRLRRLGRPEDDDRPRGVQLLLDDVRIGPVGRQIGVKPDVVAGLGKQLRHPARHRRGFPRIGDEDIRHRRR